MHSKDAVLKVNSVSVCFDGFYALNEVEAEVERGSIHFFIGPNGAGKTTLLDVICAKTKPSMGTVAFYPKRGGLVRLTGMKEHEIVREGICRKFQVPSVFKNLTVLDNMILSLKGHKGVIGSIFRRPSKEDLEWVSESLEKAGLSDRKDAEAGSLAHGEKQWLEIAMQLVQKPEVIMLDEPAAGMGTDEAYRTGGLLQGIKSECTAIVVEHDMQFVKQAADTVTVLCEGKVLKEGSFDSVLADSAVQAVYLGRGAKGDA